MGNSETFRNEILLQLKNNFNSEQLMMISEVISSVLSNYTVTKLDTQLSTYVEYGYSQDVDEFLMNKEFQGKATTTIGAYRRLLLDYVGYIHSRGTEVKNATDDTIIDYLHQHQRVRGVSNHTKDNRRLILSSFYSWMHKKGRITCNPAAAVDPIKYTQKTKLPLSQLEVEQIRFNADTALENALFETLLSTGVRVSEAAGMNIKDIDFNTRNVKVLGKGDKERYVQLSTRAIFRINVYLQSRNDDNEALFVSRVGAHKRLSKNTLEKTIKTLGEKAGLERGVHCHLLRHTFCTNAYERTKDIYLVSKLMGHAKIDTTMLYIHNTTSLKKIAQLEAEAC